MNDNSINNRIKTYYQNKYPDQDKLAGLISLADDHSQDKKHNGSYISKIPAYFGRPLAWAAGFLLVAILTFQVAGNFGAGQQHLNQRIASEIAMNHIKQLRVEYTEPDIAKLRKLMGKLDFQLVLPERIQQSDYKLVGARYCSIQGNIAAQLKLLSPKGDIHTLYETRSTDSISHIIQESQKVSGVVIDMWQEHGLLVGLAR